MAEIEINDNDARKQYIASGGQTVFPYDFPIFDDDHIFVNRTRAGVTTMLTKTTDYTVSDVGEETGGNVTLATGATVDDVITLYRDVPVERTADFTEAGDFLAITLNRELDLLTMMIQQLERDITRTVRLKIEDEASTIEIPLKAERASKFLGFDADGVAIAASGTSADLGPVSTFINTLLDDTTAAVARATLGALASDFTALTELTSVDLLLDFVDMYDASAAAHKKVRPIYMAPDGPDVLFNHSIEASVGSNALTVSLTTQAAGTPSATDPVIVGFRSTTATSGVYSRRTITTATSIVLPATGTLGFGSSATGFVYVYLCDNGSSREIGLTKRARFHEGQLYNTTAVNSASDSADVLYTTTALSSAAVRLIGRLTIQSGATAGNWSNAPTLVEPWVKGMKKTGDVVQILQTVKSDTQSATINSGATQTVTSLAQSITLTHILSKVLVEVVLSAIGPNMAPGLRLLRDGTLIGAGDAVSSHGRASSGTGVGSSELNCGCAVVKYLDSPATIAAVAYTTEIINTRASSETIVINRSNTDTDAANGVRFASTITLTEIHE